MLTEDVLRHSDLFQDSIEKAASRFPRKFRQCSLEVLMRGSEAIFCLVRGGVSDKIKNELLDYGAMQLRREVFSSDDLRSLLKAFNNTKRLTSKFHSGKSAEMKTEGEIIFESVFSPPIQTFETSQSPYHPWPGCLYQMAATGHATPGLQEALVGKGLPPFFNPIDAISNWIRVPVGNSDGRFGRFLLFIPDFTARLGRITFTDALLKVRADFTSRGLSISVLASDGRTTYRKTKPLRRAQNFKLMQNPSSLSVFVTDEKGEILDKFAEEEAWTTRERVIFAGAKYSETVMNLIRRGETDTVEFKEFVRLDDMKKAAELVKVVISFANTRGGTIFIGVTDDADIVGVEAQVPHDKRKATTFEADYFAGVRRLLKQKLNRIPPIETRSERIGDKTIFVVQVAEGAAKPYANIQTRETFVRRRGNDVRPDPDTDLRQMFESGVERLPLHWYSR